MKKYDLVLIRGKSRDDGNKCIPFGLLSIKTYLKKHGYRVKIIDRHLFIETLENTAAKVMELAPPFVGFSSMTSQFPDIVNLYKLLNKKGFKGKYIFGGTHVTAKPEDALPYADVVIRKEGEISILRYLSPGGNDEDEKVITGQILENLDEIPIPDVSLLRQLHVSNSPQINVFTARGCPFRCSFCLGPDQRTTKVRYHSIEYVIELIKRLCKAVDTRRMFIMDDIFTLNKNRVLEFCEQLKKTDLGLKWRCFTHANCGDLEMYRAMKEAGCEMVSLGIESGNNDILRLNHKNTTVEQVCSKVDEICQSGLKVEAQFLLGLLGDTLETMEDTIRLGVEINRKGASPSCGYAQPFPGSELYEKAEQYGRYLTRDQDLFYRKMLTYLPSGVSLSQMLRLHREFESRTRGRYRKRSRFSRINIKLYITHQPYCYYYRYLKHFASKFVSRVFKKE